MGLVRRYARLAWLTLFGRRLPPQRFDEVGVVHRRVWPGDLDELRHMNNGVYLSTLDLARVELMIRAGMLDRLRAAGIYPVVVAQTISYRRSLELGQRYDIETRLLGFDEKAAYVEQRHVVGGEIYARAIVGARFLRRTGGVVPIDELAALGGVVAAEHPAPAWVRDWAAAVALPSTRQPAPSVWD